MNTLKTLAARTAAVLLPVMLFSFGAYMAGYMFLGSPEPLKESLRESKIYDSLIADAVESASQESATLGSVDILQDPKMRDIVHQSFPPATFQKQAESAIDNTYAWIHGEQAKLNFALNFQDARLQFANNIGTHVEQHLGSLPTCQGGEVPNTDSILTMTCLPRNVDAAALSAQVRNDILSDQEFLESSTVTPEDYKNNQGESLEQQLSKIPAIYEHIKLGTLITGIVALCLALVVVFATVTRTRGLKHLGIITLVVGAISALLAWLAGYVLVRIISSVTIEGNASDTLTTSVLKVMQLVTQDVRNWWLGYGLALVVLGVASLVAVRILKSRGAADTEKPLAVASGTQAQTTLSSAAIPLDGSKTPDEDNKTGDIPSDIK